jgi:hypothetical protein
VGSVNKSEQYVKNALQKEGWNVMHKGYPDFLCYKIIDNKLKIQFIEVKSGNSRLTTDQRKMKEILEKVGLLVSIYCIDEQAIKSVNFSCDRCGRNIPNNTKYCSECRDVVKKEQTRESSKEKRTQGFYDLENSKEEPKLRKTWILDEKRCDCSKEQQNIEYDFKHGDAICKGCGLIIGKLYEY